MTKCAGCGKEFGAGERRYRANDGNDYCVTCGAPIWVQETGRPDTWKDED